MASCTIFWKDINSSTVPNQYRVYRDTAPIDPEVSLPAPLAEGIAKGTLSYVDNTVTFGTTYHYLVSTYTSTKEEFGEPLEITVKESVVYAYGGDIKKSAYQNSGVPLTIPAGMSGMSGSIIGLEVDEEGSIYAISSGSATVKKFDGEGNELLSISLSSAPNALAIDGEHNIYVSQGATVRKYDPTGTTLLWTSDTLFGNVDNMRVDIQGNVAVQFEATGNYNFVYAGRLDPQGALLWEVVTGRYGSYGVGVAIDPDMNLYFLHGRDYNDNENLQATALSPTGENLWSTPYLENRPPTKNGYNQLAYDPVNDCLYASAFGVHRINATDGTYTKVPGVSNLSGLCQADGYGNVVVARSDGIYTIGFDDTYSTVVPEAEIGAWVIAVEPGRYAVEHGLYLPTP